MGVLHLSGNPRMVRVLIMGQPLTIAYLGSCKSRAAFLDRFGSRPDVYAIPEAPDDSMEDLRNTLETTLNVLAGLDTRQIATGLRCFVLPSDWRGPLHPYNEGEQYSPSCVAVRVTGGRKHV